MRQPTRRRWTTELSKTKQMWLRRLKLEPLAELRTATTLSREVGANPGADASTTVRAEDHGRAAAPSKLN